MNTAPVFGISRHRLSTDGEGVTTLVAFHGCSLSCQYCINPQCLKADAPVRNLTVKALIDELMIDNLYFIATGGGVTFGGGEPLLRSNFIKEFCEQCPKLWNITLETALNVPLDKLQLIAPFISTFFIDVKDMSNDIYKRYTTRDNHHVIENLKWLSTQSDMLDKVIIRLPKIPDYNTPDDIKRSRIVLEALGFTHFDCFRYIIRK